MADSAEMGLVVVGANGRMGQALIRAIHAIDGARLSGAIARPGSPFLGKMPEKLQALAILALLSPMIRCRFSLKRRACSISLHL